MYPEKNEYCDKDRGLHGPRRRVFTLLAAGLAVVSAGCGGEVGVPLGGELMGASGTQVEVLAAPLLSASGSMRVVSYNMGHLSKSCCFPYNIDGRCARDTSDSCGGNGCGSGESLMRMTNEFFRSEAIMPGHLVDSQWNVIALQEVDEKVPRSCELDTPWKVDDALGHYDGVNPYSGWAHVFAEMRDLSNGRYGLATIANYRLDGGRSFSRDISEHGAGDSENRRAIFSRVALADFSLWVINAHLYWQGGGGFAAAEIDNLLEHVAVEIPAGDAIVLVGDLNIRTGSQPYRNMSYSLAKAGFHEIPTDKMTFPSWTPVGESDDGGSIDYAFVRDNGRISRAEIDVVIPRVGDVLLSDHRALVLDLEWGGAMERRAAAPIAAALL